MAVTETMDLLTHVLTLPTELQHRVFASCRKPTLATLSRLNKAWHTHTLPFLWSDIDFVHDFESSDLVHNTQKFFRSCTNMIGESSDHWPMIAPSVHKLNLGRLQGINIITSNNWEEYDFWDEWGNTDRNIFDVVACFVNLQSLALYMKNWWGDDEQLSKTADAVAAGSKHLKVLKLGGQMSPIVLRALVAIPENIESLSLYNLIRVPGQDNGPDGITFLDGLHDKFTSLKSLELCKLADMDPGGLSEEEDGADDEEEDDRAFVSGMRWKFPRDAEKLVLKEWARLLKTCSNTLESLTLENRYLCGPTFEEVASIDPGVTDPADYGLFSLRETKRILLPVLGKEWPKLQNLNLIGMGATEEIDEVVKHLLPRVKIVHLAAGVQIMQGDATPEEIGTPVEFHE